MFEELTNIVKFNAIFDWEPFFKNNFFHFWDGNSKGNYSELAPLTDYSFLSEE